MSHCLIFEAASIHEYLMTSGRLRHIVGASETIEALCGRTLDKSLQALGLSDSVTFSRRAGGVFVAHAEDSDALLRLARGWSLLVRELLPGMPFKLSMGTGSRWQDAAAEARVCAEGTRPASARMFPLATPFSQRHRTTGAAAVTLYGAEALDAATLAKARAADADQRTSGLGERFLPGSRWRDWPLDLSADEGGELAFPFLDPEQSLALVVADGNGLGQLLRDVHAKADSAEGAEYASILRAFSDGLEGATVASAQRAVAQVVLPARIAGAPLPMRPILLGGDDVAVIIRADLALPFAHAFAQAFEQETRQRLGAHSATLGALTASVGMVYFGRRQPIAQIQGLTYGLLKDVAKKAVKRRVAGEGSAPAAIAWHRLTVAEIQDVDALMANDWRYETSFGRVQVAGLPYLVGGSSLQDVGSLDRLLALRALLEKHDGAANKLREILGLLSSDAPAAAFRFRRWHDVDAHIADAVQAGMTAVFDGQLEANAELPLLFRGCEGDWVSPIGDLLALMAAESIPQKETRV